MKKMIDELIQKPPKRPLVSVVTICKNSQKTIQRCLKSVLGQDYSNIEYIIQDGESSDRTLEIIGDYQDERIKLISEPDAGGSDAYFKALQRCTGDVITLCWADEELLPHAVGWGVAHLEKHPEVAAIYGDVYSTDLEGTIYESSQPAPAWNLSKFLCWEIMPNYCGSFMRRKALEASGFFEFTSSFLDNGRRKLEEANCIMYDYFALVGIRHPVLHVPGFVGKFAVHSGQLSSNPKVLFAMIPGLMRSIDHICDSPRLPLALRSLRKRAYAGIHLAMVHTLIHNAKAYDDAKHMLQRAMSYDPDNEFLNQVVKATGTALLQRGQYAVLAECLDILDSRRDELPDYHFLRAAALLESSNIEAAQNAIDAGLLARPSDVRLQLMNKQLSKHIELEKMMREHVRTSRQGTSERLFFEQLLLFITLKENRIKKRLGQIMNSGVSSGTMLASADILYRFLNHPNFMSNLSKTNGDGRRLVEKTVAAYLYLMVENNAMEVAHRLAAQIVRFGDLQRGGFESCAAIGMLAN
jgi:glycosyltransferase involved in cell wall biosynthesis